MGASASSIAYLVQAHKPAPTDTLSYSLRLVPVPASSLTRCGSSRDTASTTAHTAFLMSNWLGRHLKGYLGFMNRVTLATDGWYKEHFYQTTSRSCNTTVEGAESRLESTYITVSSAYSQTNCIYYISTAKAKTSKLIQRRNWVTKCTSTTTAPKWSISPNTGSYG